jgi:hypothetical protein
MFGFVMFQNPRRLYDVHHGDSPDIGLVFQRLPSLCETYTRRGVAWTNGSGSSWVSPDAYRIAVRVGNRTPDPAPEACAGNLRRVQTAEAST